MPHHIVPIILAVIIIALGLYMVVAPERATKREHRGSYEEIAKTKRNGYIVLVLAMIMVGLAFISVSFLS